jgi:hypothetical protein
VGANLGIHLQFSNIGVQNGCRLSTRHHMQVPSKRCLKDCPEDCPEDPDKGGGAGFGIEFAAQ